MNKSTKMTIRIVTSVLIFFLGVASGRIYLEAARGSDATPRANIDMFWQVWNILDEKYAFDTPSVDNRMYGAIEGLAKAYGDDYTSFQKPEEAKFLNDTVSGKFGGIGAELNVHKGLLIVIAPLEGSPAQKAGLLPGDIILEVDDIEVIGMTFNEAISNIRGEKGTPVTLTILREGKEDKMKITVVRDVVDVPVLDTEVVDNIFVIRLYNFNETSSDKFKEALISFKRSGKEKLILDLRNNPGGYLDAAVDISSYFLDQGKVIVLEDFGDTGRDSQKYRSSGFNLLSDIEFSMVVLINEGSASASEIVAAALGEHEVATLIGETSFGKGSVQELIKLPNQTSLKITIAKWLTPKGKHIDGVGIIPEYTINHDVNTEQDLQFEAAINYLTTGNIN